MQNQLHVRESSRKQTENLKNLNSDLIKISFIRYSLELHSSHSIFLLFQFLQLYVKYFFFLYSRKSLAYTQWAEHKSFQQVSLVLPAPAKPFFLHRSEIIIFDIFFYNQNHITLVYSFFSVSGALKIFRERNFVRVAALMRRVVVHSSLFS